MGRKTNLCIIGQFYAFPVDGSLKWFSVSFCPPQKTENVEPYNLELLFSSLPIQVNIWAYSYECKQQFKSRRRSKMESSQQVEGEKNAPGRLVFRTREEDMKLK